jgi:hypothetical protein
VATPPTLSANSASTAGWAGTTTPQSASALSGQSGDYLVVVGATESDTTTLSTPTGGGFVYTLQQSIGPGSSCAVYLWTAPVTSTGSVTVSVTKSAGSGDWAFHASLWRGLRRDRRQQLGPLDRRTVARVDHDGRQLGDRRGQRRLQRR